MQVRDPGSPLYVPKKGEPMRVVVFASGGGGNLKAAIRASLARPDLLSVDLVVTDRPNIPAVDIAYSEGIPVLSYDFEAECGVWNALKDDPKAAAGYARAAENFHNKVLRHIRTFEKRHTGMDLAVLSYHRWIHGNLLDYFRGRMINQHAGDLTVRKRNEEKSRVYVGINPVLVALRAGESRTRTSTFLVNGKHDGGEILCQGPWVVYAGERPITRESAFTHELRQKEISDWPSLSFALEQIAQGHFSVSSAAHEDGCRVLCHKGRPVPYGGVDLALL